MSTPSTLNQSSNTKPLLTDINKLPKIVLDSDPSKLSNIKIDEEAKPSVKLYPLDFTHVERYRVAMRNIESPHDIMKLINGPKINDLRYPQYKLVPRLLTGAGSRLYDANLLAINNHSTHTLTTDGTFKPTFSTRGLRVQVRRSYMNQDAIVNLDWIKQNPYQRYRNKLQNPTYSILRYPNVMMSGEVDPVLKTVNAAVGVNFLDGWSYTAPATPPNITVIKLDTVENALQIGTYSGLPEGYVPVNCLYLSPATIGKLVYFGTKIIDLSNTYEGTYPAVNVSAYDSDIARTLDATLPNQDVEWAHWYASSLLPLVSMASFGDAQADYPHTELPQPDPYEMIWSFLTEVHDNVASKDAFTKWHGSYYGVYLTLSYRLAKTFLYQQAMKQIHAWFNIDQIVTKGLVTPEMVNGMLGGFYNNLGTLFDRTKTVGSNTYHPFVLAWIPYELCRACGRDIDIDDPMITNDRNGRGIAKTAVRPPSIIFASNAGQTNTTYTNAWGEVFDLKVLLGPGNWTVKSMPCYAYFYTGGDKDRSITRNNVNFAGDAIILQDKITVSSFPTPSIVFDI